MRQLKAQKAELEAALGQQREEAHAREQELLDEVAKACDATSHAQQQTLAVEEKRDALEEVCALYCPLTAVICMAGHPSDAVAHQRGMFGMESGGSNHMF